MNLCGRPAVYIPNSDCECYEKAVELVDGRIDAYFKRIGFDIVNATMSDRNNASATLTVLGKVEENG